MIQIPTLFPTSLFTSWIYGRFNWGRHIRIKMELTGRSTKILSRGYECSFFAVLQHVWLGDLSKPVQWSPEGTIDWNTTCSFEGRAHVVCIFVMILSYVRFELGTGTITRQTDNPLERYYRALSSLWKHTPGLILVVQYHRPYSW